MTNRIIDLAEGAAFVQQRDGLLVIHRQSEKTVRIPLGDVAVVVASNREVTFTQSALAALASSGAVVVCCDEKHMPAAMLMPLQSHSTQAERFRKQAVASAPVRKQIWREIVRAKIAAQGLALRRVRGEDAGLVAMAWRVRSGDAGNLEAVAAQRYWVRLFGGAFRRGGDGDARNGLLDYGYAIIRAACARAVCAGGLHPSLGVHHANRYNAFALADDLMEPCRPLVDRAVVDLSEGEGGLAELTRGAKAALIGVALRRYTADGERRTLFDILGRTAQGLAARLIGDAPEFQYPEIDAE